MARYGNMLLIHPSHTPIVSQYVWIAIGRCEYSTDNDCVHSSAITESQRPQTLLSIDPNASLYDAAQTLLTEKIHRLPV